MFKDALDAYEHVFAACDQAADCETYAWPFDYSASPDDFSLEVLGQAQARRHGSNVLDGRAIYLARAGEPDEAAMVYLQLLTINRLQANQPLLLSYLVYNAGCGVTIRGLAGLIETSELKPETHAAIEKELAATEGSDAFVQALKSDRAFGIEKFRSLPNPLGINNRDWQSYLELMSHQIEIGGRSQFEIVDDYEFPTTAMAGGMEPILTATRESVNYNRATIRCLRVLNAIHWKTMRAEGIQLSDLDLPADATTDPYNGKPLQIKLTEEGWLVYAVGPDGVDDAGQVRNVSVTGPPDIGIGPSRIRAER